MGHRFLRVHAGTSYINLDHVFELFPFSRSGQWFVGVLTASGEPSVPRDVAGPFASEQAARDAIEGIVSGSALVAG